MVINQLCATMKEKVASALQEAAGPHERTEVLIAALYELERSIFAQLGPPKNTEEYTGRQGVVLDLISFIALQLIRGEDKDCRAVAVITEVAEGCADPFLKKKLSFYAHELLVKPEGEPGKPERIDFARIFFIVGMVVLGVVLVFSAWPGLLPAKPANPPVVAGPQPPRQAAPSPHSAVVAQSAVPPRSESVDGGSDDATPPEKGSTEAKTVLAAQSDVVTRIRIVNGQLLVPVTLKNSGESVRVELVLDTGATRTCIHENLAGRLRIDLKGARLSQSEMADGRVVASRIARIDSLNVGPQTMGSAEVELIPYKGSDGMHDGLLGLDFLAKRRYQIDMEHEIIRWF